MKGRVALLLCACCLGSAACSLVGDELYAPLDETAPQVVETFPAHEWVQVPVGVTLRIWFSEAVDPGSVNVASLSLESGENLARCRYRVWASEDGLGLVEMTPLNPLIGGVRYRLQIGRQVRDLYGNALADSLAVEFTTLR